MVSVILTNLVSCLVGFVLSWFYKSNFSCSLLVARTVQPFFLLSFDLDINTLVADRNSFFPTAY